jgi:hypothetical protein
MRLPLVKLLAALAVLAALPGEASATSGFGCYRVNVGPNDPLRIRQGPSARSAAIAAYHWDNQPIIALDGGLPRGEGVQPTLFDAWRAEREVCVPSNLPVGARWCPVTVFDGGGSRSGWLKRRFVDFSECP